MKIEPKKHDIKRNLSLDLLAKLRKGSSFLLLGPRQTGKSTLIESLFNQIPESRQLRYYLQLPQQKEALENDPELLLREVEAKVQNKPALFDDAFQNTNPFPKTSFEKGAFDKSSFIKKGPVFVFIDEIQKIPKLFDVLQFLIDKKKIVLAGCGSSARQMRRLKSNWLPGRVHLEHLYPLTWAEMASAQASLSLDDVLVHGALPKIFLDEDIDDKTTDLESYAYLYLDEEIRSEAVTRNLPRFTRFLRLAALESGTSPNYSKIGQMVDGAAHTTIADYYQILVDTLIVHELPAFCNGKSRDQVLRSPRYYFFDMGVRNAAAQLPLSPGILNLQRGVLFEHFVVLEAIAHFAAKNRLSYFRTKTGQEVDLVIEGRQKRVILEIKSTAKPSPKDFYGLNSFLQKNSADASFLICQIAKPQKFGKHLALPATTCFEILRDFLT